MLRVILVRLHRHPPNKLFVLFSRFSPVSTLPLTVSLTTRWPILCSRSSLNEPFSPTVVVSLLPSAAGSSESGLGWVEASQSHTASSCARSAAVLAHRPISLCCSLYPSSLSAGDATDRPASAASATISRLVAADHSHRQALARQSLDANCWNGTIMEPGPCRSVHPQPLVAG